MIENELTLPYGCPNCGVLSRETGAFKEIRKTKRTLIRSMLHFLRIASTPTVEVIEREPVKEYYYRSITIPLGPPEVDALGHRVQSCTSSCPYCRTKFIASRDAVTGEITWCVYFGPKDANYYVIERCEKCGEE